MREGTVSHVAPPRLVYLGIAALTVVGLALVALTGSSEEATTAAQIALVAQCAVALVLAAIHRDPLSPTRRALHIVLMAVLGLLTAPLGWFYGLHSGFSGFLATTLIIVGLLSRGSAVRHPRIVGFSIYGSIAVAQLAVAVAVASGALPDASLVPLFLPTFGVPQVIFAHASMQVIYFAAFAAGRGFQRRYNELAKQVDETVRKTAEREALLDEARSEYRRALAAGRQGVFSGAKVGEYELSALVGRGASGEIYDAVHVETRARVAIKLLRGDRLEPAVVERFLREGEIAQSIDSPAVPRVLAMGERPVPFIAMEPLVGDELVTLLARGPLDRDALRTLTEDLASALGCVHAAGALHLDVSPRNVMRTAEGWKLVDFGAAQLASAVPDASPMGTRSYVAPERVAGRAVDRRADVYAFAAVLYAACTGNEPTGSPPSAPAVEPSLADVLRIGLAEDPNDRFATAAELRDAIVDALEGRGSAHAERACRLRPWGTRSSSSRITLPPPRRVSTMPPPAAPSQSRAGSAWQAAFRWKSGVFHRAVLGTALFGALLLWPIVREREALFVAWASIAGIVITLLVARRQGITSYRPWAIVGALSVGPTYALGFNAAFCSILAILLFTGGVFSSGRRDAWRTQRGLVLGTIVAVHTVGFALVLFGVVPDLGNAPLLPSGTTPLAATVLHVATMLVYGGTFALSVAIDARHDALTQRAEAAAREAAHKEALLSTAREQLDQLLRGERAGIFSGLSLGGFEVGPLLGRGSMGEVYEARAEGTRAAMKVVRADVVSDPFTLRMFLREAEALRRISSRHVARVLAVSSPDDEVPFIAMELVDGPLLIDVLRARGRLPLVEVRTLVAEIGRGLADVHRAGVVHRDIKPSNVIHDQGAVWKLVDFGVARLLDAPQTRSLVGTPSYMAPEQALGEPVDARADLYSFCLVVYRALTGRNAYQSRDPLEVARKAREQGPPDPRAIAPDLPEPVVAALLRGLSADPGDRYRDAEEMTAAFEDAFGGRAASRPDVRAVAG